MAGRGGGDGVVRCCSSLIIFSRLLETSLDRGVKLTPEESRCLLLVLSGEHDLDREDFIGLGCNRGSLLRLGL